MSSVFRDRSDDAFRTTCWTQVLAARGKLPQSRDALCDLCQAYYGPVEAFVRRYRAGQEDVRDLTQEFFARLLEGDRLKGVDPAQGRFRTYLLGAVKHFLSDQVDRTRAAKRGGGQLPLSLQSSGRHSQSPCQESLSLDVVDPHAFPPDAFFDRHWALTIVERAMSALQAAASLNVDEQHRFEILKPWLIPSEAGATAAEAAQLLNMTEGAFKVAVHRLRQHFRRLVKDQVAASVDGPDAISGELDYLIQALTTAE